MEFDSIDIEVLSVVTATYCIYPNACIDLFCNCAVLYVFCHCMQNCGIPNTLVCDIASGFFSMNLQRAVFAGPGN